VTVLDQDGSVSLTIGNGQVLLGGNSIFPLHAVASADDPTRTVLAYSAPDGIGQTTPLELRETAISGCHLGGLLNYRREVLDTVQNDLGRLAAGLSLAVNRQHEAGFDTYGNPGEAFFSVGMPTVITSQN